MPPKNSIKVYQAGAYYHIYNRGVDKRDIFMDDIDYKTFLSYLRLYLTDPKLQGLSLKLYPSKQLKNYAGAIDLLCYCLMPNHFHLLVRQSDSNSIKGFMSSLATKYSMYINKKYGREGRLFQGVYKAVRVLSEQQLVYLTKYIHLNPQGKGLLNHRYFSLPNYLGNIKQKWLKPDAILDYFSDIHPNFSYKSFLGIGNDLNLISDITID